MRQVDCVTLKGSSQPIKLFTCDLDCSRLQVGARRERSAKTLEQSRQEKQIKRVRQRLERARLQQ